MLFRRRNLSRLWLKILVAAGAAAPTSAWACAVCRFGEKDPSGDAFFLSTILMSLVPLGAIGSGLYYIYRRVHKAGSGEP